MHLFMYTCCKCASIATIFLSGVNFVNIILLYACQAQILFHKGRGRSAKIKAQKYCLYLLRHKILEKLNVLYICTQDRSFVF